MSITESLFGGEVSLQETFPLMLFLFIHKAEDSGQWDLDPIKVIFLNWERGGLTGINGPITSPV